MSKDGINVNQAPDDFYRPQIPPVAPPPANSSTVKPLPCRCGREAEWLLDGSLFGCNSCFVSGTSMADWNALVGVDPAQPEAQSGYESWKSGYAEGWRVGSKVAVDERLQLKTENDALKAKRLARAARAKKLVDIANTHRRDALVLRKDLESHKRMLLAAACDLGAIGESLGLDMDSDGDEMLGMVAELKAERDQLRAEIAGLKTGYEAYEQVVQGLKTENEALRRERQGKVLCDLELFETLRDSANTEADEHRQCMATYRPLRQASLDSVVHKCDDLLAAMSKEASHG